MIDISFERIIIYEFKIHQLFCILWLRVQHITTNDFTYRLEHVAET